MKVVKEFNVYDDNNKLIKEGDKIYINCNNFTYDNIEVWIIAENGLCLKVGNKFLVINFENIENITRIVLGDE